MPLSWNEIRDRARRFSREWADEASEDAEAKSFWDAFFDVFGVSRRRVASFERRIKKLDGKDGYKKAVGRKIPKLTTDAERVVFLFDRYQALIWLLPPAKVTKSRRKPAKVAKL